METIGWVYLDDGRDFVEEQLLDAAALGQEGLCRFHADVNVVAEELNDEEWFVEDEDYPEDAQADQGALDEARTGPEVKELDTLLGQRERGE